MYRVGGKCYLLYVSWLVRGFQYIAWGEWNIQCSPGWSQLQLPDAEITGVIYHACLRGYYYIKEFF